MSDEKKERPQDRWDKKNGYISKSFKMYRTTAERFVKACEMAGRPQASVISELMDMFSTKTEAEFGTASRNEEE